MNANDLRQLADILMAAADAAARPAICPECDGTTEVFRQISGRNASWRWAPCPVCSEGGS